MGFSLSFPGKACLCSYLARPFQVQVERGGLCNLSEGSGYWVPKVEGTALGWFHRAAKTSRSQQWKDNGPMHYRFTLLGLVGAPTPPILLFP